MCVIVMLKLNPQALIKLLRSRDDGEEILDQIVETLGMH